MMSFLTFASSDTFISFDSLRGAKNLLSFALWIRGRYTATLKAYLSLGLVRQP
jgi:hypothetical protein